LIVYTMDFKQAALLGSCLSKDYAEDLFKLLVTYKNISASEAASRLDLHIKTVQDYLEDLFKLQILEKDEVLEGKRPYFRYSMKVKRITMEIDLAYMLSANEETDSRINYKIREKTNSGVRFTTSRSNDYISNIVIWRGEGRNRTERKFNLSIPQGKFLFHLPFPSADYLSINEIMIKAGIDFAIVPEIIDIVNVLIESGVIEKK
jgi:predicted transcriptional regulator